MKRYKKILMIWICAIVVVAVSVIVAGQRIFLVGKLSFKRIA